MRGLTTYVLMPLTIIGALNWGLLGIFGFDLVAFIFGPATIASSIVYCLSIAQYATNVNITINFMSSAPSRGVFCARNLNMLCIASYL